MFFPFALSRILLLSFIIISNVISSVLSVIAFREQTGGVFQVLAVSLNVLGLLAVIGCLWRQYTRRDEEASNMRNLCLFGVCGLFGLALAVSLTIHARRDMGTCGDFVYARSPCVPAGVQLGMAYVSAVFALLGFVISWIDKFPGAVKVAPRYPITKAPSSHFAAYGHDLDDSYTHPPVKAASGPLNNSEWSDVPLDC